VREVVEFIETEYSEALSWIILGSGDGVAERILAGCDGIRCCRERAGGSILDFSQMDLWLDDTGAGKAVFTNGSDGSFEFVLPAGEAGADPLLIGAYMTTTADDRRFDSATKTRPPLSGTPLDQYLSSVFCERTVVPSNGCGGTEGILQRLGIAYRRFK
jgi:hypothetical protein